MGKLGKKEFTPLCDARMPVGKELTEDLQNVKHNCLYGDACEQQCTQSQETREKIRKTIAAELEDEEIIYSMFGTEEF